MTITDTLLLQGKSKRPTCGKMEAPQLVKMPDEKHEAAMKKLEEVLFTNK